MLKIMQPGFRLQLFEQSAPAVQRPLFAADVEPHTEPPCDHPEAGYQSGLFNEVEYCCTFCGAAVLELGATS